MSSNKKIKSLFIMMIVIGFVAFGTSHVMAQAEKLQMPPPSPPISKYPYTSKISSVLVTDKTVHPNEIAVIRITVTNNANYPMFDVNVGESSNDSSISIYGLRKIDILEPNNTKAITGQLYIPPDTKPNDHDIWWNIIAKNETGGMIESAQFHRNLSIVENDTFYGWFENKNLLPPLQQAAQGKPREDISCNSGFQIIKRSHGDIPACVMPESTMTLVKRGWAQNPLSGTEIPQDKQETVLDTLMNYGGIRDWSKTGWIYMGSIGRFPLNESGKYTFDLYLPPRSGDPKIDCDTGWHAWLTFDAVTTELVGHDYPTKSQHVCGNSQSPSDKNDMPKFVHDVCDMQCKKEKESKGSVCYPIAYNDYYCVTTDPGKSVVIIPSSFINPSDEHSNFIPETVYVKIGVNNTVEWDNTSGIDISISGDQGIFESKDFTGKWSHTFDTPGRYIYHGHPFPWMYGVVVVTK